LLLLYDNLDFEQTATALLEALRASASGDSHPTPDDLLRVVIVVYLSSSSIMNSKEEWALVEAELQEAGADIRPLLYAKRWEQKLAFLFSRLKSETVSKKLIN
jgi:hypothetical protein